MIVDTKPLAEISEADLLGLVTNQVPEGQTIDYKENLAFDREDGNNEHGRRELRKDVTSFANALGGSLVVGMGESGGFPTALNGIDVADQEAYKQRILAILDSKITPRVPGVAVAVVPLSSGKQAVIIRVPRSFTKPHQIEGNGADDLQFWMRNGTDNRRMNVDQLRSVMLQSANVAERLRQFRMDRVGSVIANDTPIAVVGGAKIVFHLIPLDSFDASASYDMSALGSREFDDARVTLRYDGPSTYANHNAEGYIAFDQSGQGKVADSYVQVFRNGIIEYVDTYWLSTGESNDKPLWYPQAEQALLATLDRGLRLQEAMGASASTAVLLSLTGAAKCQMMRSMPLYRYSQSQFGRDLLLLPDIVVNRPIDSLAKAMRPVFDALWNAGGYPRCLNYDAEGNWKAV